MNLESNPQAGVIPPKIVQQIKERWKSFLLIGIISVIMGAVALLAPLLATLTLSWVVGAVLLVNGVSNLIHSFKTKGAGNFIWSLVVSIFYLTAGGLFFARPLLGAVTLTVMLAVFFIVEGIFKLVMAMRLKPAPNWGWLLLSGVLPLILGVFIWSRWPVDATWVPGVFLGIDLLFGGWSLILLSWSARRA